MNGKAYYNENDPNAVNALRWLIANGHIADGAVDDRGIEQVQPEDLAGFTQHHFFAGIGGWSLACRLAGWPDSRPIWTASCPCQPFSVAGKGAGESDPRHLWPHLFRLLAAVRPVELVGEQVTGAAGLRWFDGVAADLDSRGYTSRAVDIPACAVDAPHIRQRLYWVAVADAEAVRLSAGPYQQGGRSAAIKPQRQDGRRTVADAEGIVRRGDIEIRGPEGRAVARGIDEGRDLGVTIGDGWRARRHHHGEHDGSQFGAAGGQRVDMEQPDGIGRGQGRADDVRAGRSLADAAYVFNLGDGDDARPQGFAVAGGQQGAAAGRSDAERADRGDSGRRGSWWADAEWLACHDGKARRTQPGLPLLAHGVSGRVAAWRGFGNAIVPPLAAEVIGALMDVRP